MNDTSKARELICKLHIIAGSDYAGELMQEAATELEQLATRCEAMEKQMQGLVTVLEEHNAINNTFSYTTLIQYIDGMVEAYKGVVMRCDKCRYWDSDGQNNADLHADDHVGECKRNPPVLDIAYIATRYFVGGTHEYETESDWTLWEQPATPGSNWCGEFKEKDQPASRP